MRQCKYMTKFSYRYIRNLRDDLSIAQFFISAIQVNNIYYSFLKAGNRIL